MTEEMIYQRLINISLYGISSIALFLLAGWVFDIVVISLNNSYSFFIFSLAGWVIFLLALVFLFFGLILFFYPLEETLYNDNIIIFLVIIGSGIILVIISILTFLTLINLLVNILLFTCLGILISYIATYLLKLAFGDTITELLDPYLPD